MRTRFNEEDFEYADYYHDGKADRLIAAAPQTAAERDHLREINTVLATACEALIVDIEGCETLEDFSILQRGWAIGQARIAIAKAKVAPITLPTLETIFEECLGPLPADPPAVTLDRKEQKP